jgi:hypothetical protein
MREMYIRAFRADPRLRSEREKEKEDTFNDNEREKRE